ncbi:phosphate regulon transcriptional regulator PhoB [Allosphingosinicella sp.]|jgi:two-component system phosphate regulon response regulator PhoB|uniref:phosphate regulon transcriptional regulator PhoB n=1 Tax=Allosphingosinicella sp. TaxID=2823234 RepID=UPI002F185593
MTKAKLLLVEDDPALRDLLTFHFEREGFAIASTADGEEALLLAEEDPPDLVILDWMIEEVSGIEVCRRLRRRPATAQVPIVMLTARADEGDRIRGLETGADDYVTKPFSPRELIARVGAIFRRRRPALAGATLAYAGVKLDPAAAGATRDGQPLAMGPTELRLLHHFLQSPGRVFSREQLLDAVWPSNRDIEFRTVDVHIRRLRVALNAGSRPDLIRTVRNFGYSLESASD